MQLIGQMLLHDGVQQQVEAFRTGFIDILPLDGLLNFSEEEIDTLVCGDSKFWDVASFIEQVHCAHILFVCSLLQLCYLHYS